MQEVYFKQEKKAQDEHEKFRQLFEKERSESLQVANKEVADKKELKRLLREETKNRVSRGAKKHSALANLIAKTKYRKSKTDKK